MGDNESTSSLDSFRWRIARLACRPLPPILAQRVRSWIFPWSAARRLAREFNRRSVTGSAFASNTADFHAYPFSVHGYFEWRNLAIAAAVTRPGDCVLEIGANIGTETIGFADIVGKDGSVHAFEPLPANVTHLENLARLNPARAIHIHQLALSDRAGRLHFEIPPSDSSGVGHLVAPGSTEHAETLVVECRTLDSLADEVPAASAVFVDTEGEEVRILRGGRSYLERHRPVLVVEASPKLLKKSGASLAELLELLRSLDYRPFRLGTLSLEPVVDDRQNGASNWVCIPAVDSASALRIKQSIRRCAWLPTWFPRHPLRTAHCG